MGLWRVSGKFWSQDADLGGWLQRPSPAGARQWVYVQHVYTCAFGAPSKDRALVQAPQSESWTPAVNSQTRVQRGAQMEMT